MPKDGKENLRPPRSSDEARENGRKGGIASGESRRKKRDLRETLEELLKTKLKDTELLEQFGKAGFAEKGMTMQDAITAAMIQQAAQGNVKAYTAIRDTIAPLKGEDAQAESGTKVIIQVGDCSGKDDTGP